MLGPCILQVQRTGLMLNFQCCLRLTLRSKDGAWTQWLVIEPLFLMDSFYLGLNQTHDLQGLSKFQPEHASLDMKQNMVH